MSRSTTPARPPEDFHPIDRLRDWIRNGTRESLDETRRFLAQGASFVATNTDQAAAMSFVSIPWKPSIVDETTVLMREFIAAGVLAPGQRIEMVGDHLGRKSMYHDRIAGRHPLLTALNNMNLPATVVLIGAGAIEVTNFEVKIREDVVDRKMTAFEFIVERHWGGMPAHKAKITEAVMNWRLQKALEGTRAAGDGADGVSQVTGPGQDASEGVSKSCTGAVSSSRRARMGL
ncbi:hypothetical protein ABIC83_002747 [Roseateles asaccharophilus]|uniref:hypothetical protein n=1 Tax=Roseateles asaccharophilus TaxID=582607 RepID=UPI003832D84B